MNINDQNTYVQGAPENLVLFPPPTPPPKKISCLPPWTVLGRRKVVSKQLSAVHISCSHKVLRRGCSGLWKKKYSGTSGTFTNTITIKKTTICRKSNEVLINTAGKENHFGLHNNASELSLSSIMKGAQRIYSIHFGLRRFVCSSIRRSVSHFVIFLNSAISDAALVFDQPSGGPSMKSSVHALIPG